MILCIDIGNTQLYAGVFKDGQIAVRFRMSSVKGKSSDEIGIFLTSALRENEIDPSQIEKISVCTVVPEVVHALKGACIKYFNKEAFFVDVGTKTGLKIKYKNPAEVGADRIANAMAAIEQFPEKNLIIVDFGTATTFDAISSNKDYLGGIIIPGVKLSMTSLYTNTSKLPPVEIKEPAQVVGRTTVESIQSGLYFGQIGMISYFVDKISKEAFPNSDVLVIGTGGMSNLFFKESLFHVHEPDLILLGLKRALELNC